MRKISSHLVLIVSVLFMFVVSGCSKDENESDKDKIGSAEEFLDLPLEKKAATFRNVDKIFNTRAIKRGGSIFPLPESDNMLTSVKYSLNGVNTYDIDDFITRNNVAGLLIIKDGKIVLERYAQGNTEKSKWTSFSVAKSVTSTLIGFAVKDGKIALNDLVTKYLPQMKGTAYDGVTVRQLMQMSSGAEWVEDYLDKSTVFSEMFQCILDGKAGGIIDVMSSLKRVEEPGKRFLYSTGEAYLEGEVLSAALDGESLSNYLSRKVWATMGMESDAYWLLESPDGMEFGGGNISMILRDYGRFGMFILNDGVVNGTHMLPQGWTDEAGKPAGDSPQCGYEMLYSASNLAKYPYDYPLGYGYNWWAMPEAEWGPWSELSNPDWWGDYAIETPSVDFPNLTGTFEAQGVFGQLIHINQKENMVTVVWSTWSAAWIDPKEYEMYRFIDAATGYLKK